MIPIKFRLPFHPKRTKNAIKNEQEKRSRDKGTATATIRQIQTDSVGILLPVTPFAKYFLASSILRLMNPSICQLIAYPESGWMVGMRNDKFLWKYRREKKIHPTFGNNEQKKGKHSKLKTVILYFMKEACSSAILSTWI